MKRALPTLLAFVFLPLALFARLPLDDAKDLKSKDPDVRLAAVHHIIESGGEDAGKLLTRALKDDDWQVVAEAATALGDFGKPETTSTLAKLAWDGASVPVRMAAARAAAKLDLEKALKELAKKMSGDRARHVLEAYAIVLKEAPEETRLTVPKAILKQLKAKDTLTRAAAARALILASRKDRGARLTELLDSEYTAVIAAALEAAAQDPRPGQLEPITKLLAPPTDPKELDRATPLDVIERRALTALIASLSVDSNPARAFGVIVAHLGTTPSGPRLVDAAAKESWFDPAAAPSSLEPALASDSPGVRAAAVHAMRWAPKPESLTTLQQYAEADPAARVRRAAVASALAVAGPDDQGQLAWLLKRLTDEPDPAIREDLAVALGVDGLAGVDEALIAALEDPDWGVALCAAVSLGRTRSEAATAPLIALTRKSLDWRLRGAGVVGLCHVMRKEVVLPLIERLADPEPLVARTALGFLKSINKSAPTSADPEAWLTWWTENEKRVKLTTPKEAAARREKYGYAVSPTELYAGLDVMVFQSRGDHIETVLDFLGLNYRKTSSNLVPASALDAAGVFVSNCTGEMQPPDVERLRWFTKAGGYLFGSCWALHETVERVAHGAIRKFETGSEVLDQVTATACDSKSPYLKGVFTPGVVPIYHLVGAHLIEVLEPERVDVLIDSAECAEHWGSGNLAAWYHVGHGRILDSVNHFDAQGLAETTGLKTPEDRMAFAVDHMGISLQKIRETRDEKWWSGSMKASREIRDLSVFTLITNFVRARRIESY